MAGAAAVKSLRTFDEAWPILQEEAINKLIDSLETEGQPRNRCFTSDDYMRLVVYNVCSPNQLSPEVQKMYDQYKKTFEDYISSKVLPSLRGKEDVNLLTELLRRWKIYKSMNYWLSRFFNYLSRYYIPLKKLPSLEETSNLAFYNLVCDEIKDQVNDAIVSMINREREGEQIDRAFLKEILEIYEVIGKDSSKYYREDIEKAIVEATCTFYSRKALNWIANLSYEDYMLKVEECSQQEKNRISDYLKGLWSKDKLLEAVHHELLNVQASKLEELTLLHGAV
ncbi:cullin-1 [Phtheirospermum japonicum]|uniref:Cullin-1 n=1 Tax=Phtheirospermum japonicum TaxID=374723 RepID=A0A830D5V5_9LAMI|nr:cullin-1 [Phtheirospermum japonicum]